MTPQRSANRERDLCTQLVWHQGRENFVQRRQHGSQHGRHLRRFGVLLVSVPDTFRRFRLGRHQQVDQVTQA